MSHVSDAKEGQKTKIAPSTRLCRTQNSGQRCGITASFYEMKMESDLLY